MKRIRQYLLKISIARIAFAVGVVIFSLVALVLWQGVSGFAVFLGIIATALGIHNSLSISLAKPDIQVKIENIDRILYRCERGQYHAWQVDLLLWNEGKATGYVKDILLKGEKKDIKPLDKGIGHVEILFIDHQLDLIKLPRTAPLFELDPGKVTRQSLLFLPDVVNMGDKHTMLTMDLHRQNKQEKIINPEDIKDKTLKHEDFAEAAGRIETREF